MQKLPVRSCRIPVLCLASLLVAGTAFAGDTRPLQSALTGASATEPAICEGLASPQREMLDGTQLAGSIDVSPASTEAADLEPDTTYTHCLYVHNRQSQRERFRLSVIELAGSPDPDKQLIHVDQPVALGRWIHPSLTSFSLDPGERIRIPYTIDVPRDVPRGSLVAAIKVSQAVEVRGGSTGAGVEPSLLQRIYVTFPGGRSERPEVSDVDAPRILSRSRRERVYTSHFTVRNRGTVLDTFRTELEVRGLGREVGSASTGPVALLPNAATRVEQDWDDVPWIGIYRPHAKVLSRYGEQRVELPMLIVVPPIEYVVLVVIALTAPIGIVVLRRLRRRRERADGLRSDVDPGPDDDHSNHADDLSDDVEFDGAGEAYVEDGDSDHDEASFGRADMPGEAEYDN